MRQVLTAYLDTATLPQARGRACTCIAVYIEFFPAGIHIYVARGGCGPGEPAGGVFRIIVVIFVIHIAHAFPVDSPRWSMERLELSLTYTLAIGNLAGTPPRRGAMYRSTPRLADHPRPRSKPLSVRCLFTHIPWAWAPIFSNGRAVQSRAASAPSSLELIHSDGILPRVTMAWEFRSGSHFPAGCSD